MSVTERLGEYLASHTSRRSLARTTMAATALSVSPADFLLRPGTAYAANAYPPAPSTDLPKWLPVFGDRTDGRLVHAWSQVGISGWSTETL
jgi:hypothetical protein